MSENKQDEKLNRYVTVSVDLLSRAKADLLKHDNESNVSFTHELREFIDEITLIKGSRKNYTHGRAAKIAVAISILYHANKMIMESSVRELVDNLEKNLKGEIAKAFSQAARDITLILSRHPSRTFKSAQVYFIDETSLQELQNIQKSLEVKFEKKSDDRIFGIRKIINVLNPDNLCTKYDVNYLPRGKQINKEASVDYYFEGDYSQWKNKIVEEYNEKVRVHKPDTMTLKRMKKELELELMRGEEEHEFIVNNREKMEVRIIEYEDAAIHPRITITSKEKTFHLHLRSEVPNALWFSLAPFRADMSVDEFIASSKHAYGNVYYRMKEEED